MEKTKGEKKSKAAQDAEFNEKLKQLTIKSKRDALQDTGVMKTEANRKKVKEVNVECYVLALTLNPKDEDAWCKLGCSLDLGETTAQVAGKTYTAQQYQHKLEMKLTQGTNAFYRQ